MRRTLRPLLAPLLALPLLPAMCAAAEPPPSAEAFFTRPHVMSAQLSPSGAYVALTTSRGSRRVDLAVIALKPSIRAARLVHDERSDVGRFFWVGDDKLVYTLADYDTAWGDDRSLGSGLYAVDLAGHRRQLITRSHLPDEKRLASDVKTLNAHYMLLKVPEGQPSVAKDEVVIGKIITWADKHITSIRPQWLNIRDGTTREMALGPNPPKALRWWFDSKGEARMAASGDSERTSYYWRAPGQDEWQLMFDPDQKRPYRPVAVDDVGQLYAVHDIGPRGERALFRLDMQTLALPAEPLLQAPGFDVNAGLIAGEPGQAPLGLRNESEVETTEWFDPGMKAFQAEVDARFPGHINQISCRRCGRPDMVALVYSYADRDPGSYWVFDAAAKDWQNVANRLDTVDPARMAHVRMDRIKARDGEDLPVWLTLPAGWIQGAPPAPAVVLVHGGPWVRNGHWQWQPQEQFLAARGYLVISPEFRGSAGYGYKHLRAGDRQWGQAMQDDVADALRWAQAQGLAAKEACIIGGSYGGYSTLMGLVRDPELYRCGVAWAAVADLFLYMQGDWSTSDDISDEGRRTTVVHRVGDPVKDAEMLRSVSPLVQAARIKAPLLLVYGGEDRRVPVEHGTRLRAAMTAAGNPPEWKEFRDEVHGFTTYEHQAEFAQELERFLARHLPVPAAAAKAASAP